MAYLGIFPGGKGGDERQNLKMANMESQDLLYLLSPGKNEVYKDGQILDLGIEVHGRVISRYKEQGWERRI